MQVVCKGQTKILITSTGDYGVATGSNFKQLVRQNLYMLKWAGLKCLVSDSVRQMRQQSTAPSGPFMRKFGIRCRIDMKNRFGRLNGGGRH